MAYQGPAPVRGGTFFHVIRKCGSSSHAHARVATTTPPGVRLRVTFSAKANVILPDKSEKKEILCGGLETTSVVNGYATGTLTVGDDCSEISAVAGSVSDSEEITTRRVENVGITVGERAAFVGGILKTLRTGRKNALVTAVSRCSVESAEINAGEDSDASGGMVGGSSASAVGNGRSRIPDHNRS